MAGQRKRIVFLGSGNVAWHLAPALATASDVVQIWSRNDENARLLAERIPGCEVADSPDRIVSDADFYVISVTDDAIPQVARMLKHVTGTVIHTSGAFPLEELKNILPEHKAGVFYPLQTFSKMSNPDISQTPLLIEGDTDQTLHEILDLGKSVSANVREVNSDVRRKIHIAAVFACNFANYLWDTADSFLKDETPFDFTLLHPLLTETLKKAVAHGPHASQTGPAVRNDIKTMESHLAELDGESAEIYRYLSELIRRKHKK